MIDTVDQLVDSVKRRATLPDLDGPGNGGLADPATILDVLNEEMLSFIVPQMMSLMESYFQTEAVIPLVQDQRYYDLPSDAMGLKVADISLVTTASQRVRKLSRIDLSNESQLENSQLRGFRFEGARVRLTWLPNDPSESLRITYFARPAPLVAGEDFTQLPKELGPVLAQAAAVKIMEALGDRGGIGPSQVKLQELLTQMVHFLTPRADTAPKKIVNRNWFGRGW